ncbi:MAG: c-type cytochrome [Chromatiaceae bacterium]
MPRTPRVTVHLTGLALLGLTILAGCGERGEVTLSELPRFDDGYLSAGRSIWMNTCRNCHLMGVNHILGVAHSDQWDQRLAKGREALYQSVILGMTGPGGAVLMPPRGGDLQLSDADVRAAVDYNLAAVEALRTSRAP